MWRVVGVVALVAIAAACVPEEEPPPPPPPPKVFVVYGDSLVGESMAALSAQLAVVLPGWEIRYQVWGGTAQCDFHPSMIDDAANFNVGGVAIAFSGNNLTGCIQSRPYVEGYREDAHWAVSFWRDRGIPVLFVAAPGVVGAEVTNRPIPNVYISVGSAREVPLADSAPLFAQGSPAVFAARHAVSRRRVHLDDRGPAHRWRALLSRGSRDRVPAQLLVGCGALRRGDCRWDCEAPGNHARTPTLDGDHTNHYGADHQHHNVVDDNKYLDRHHDHDHERAAGPVDHDDDNDYALGSRECHVRRVGRVG